MAPSLLPIVLEGWSVSWLGTGPGSYPSKNHVAQVSSMKHFPKPGLGSHLWSCLPNNAGEVSPLCWGMWVMGMEVVPKRELEMSEQPGQVLRCPLLQSVSRENQGDLYPHICRAL